MGNLWKRGLVPADLEKHFYLTWFAYWNGNVFRWAKASGIHRNTLILIFQEKLRKSSTIQLRELWFRIQSQSSKKGFADRLHAFYQKVASAPRFTKAESEGLSNLWLMGFPFKLLRIHYVLWAAREGLNKPEMMKKLGLGVRSLARIKASGGKPGSPAWKWFAPLKPTINDWYEFGQPPKFGSKAYGRWIKGILRNPKHRKRVMKNLKKAWATRRAQGRKAHRRRAPGRKGKGI